MKNLDSLRSLVTEGKLPDEVENEQKPRSATRYIGDVLDMVIGSGFMSKDEVDDAASVIADYAEDGPEAVVNALIQKGHVKGGKLLDGGHKKLRARMMATMAEWIDQGFFDKQTLSEGRLTTRQLKMKESFEASLREGLRRVLMKEGYTEFNVDEMIGRSAGRIRGIANKLTMEASRRGVKPVTS